MYKLTPIVFITTLLLLGCSNTKPQQVTSKSNSSVCAQNISLGGWFDSEVTPDIERAVVNAVSSMSTHPKLKQINKLSYQVVNGINYAVEFTLENGKIWNMVLLNNQRGDFIVEHLPRQGKLCP